ncbi:MAG TPA: hypothetical protein P5081_19465 [Phycisphaerae bacterium]|nr:hypothetical protein [Phycisphaerae bacterium]HRW55055.1 hypothetical protein [Phycisphaerae bacterium]
MTESPQPAPTGGDANVTPPYPAAFTWALGVAAVGLLLLDCILGALMWLPFFSGLLGFFIEGLIAGGIAFRVARAARPVPRRRLWSGILLLTAISMVGVVTAESFWFSWRIGRPPNFTTLRNVILKGEADETRRLDALTSLSDESIAKFQAYLDGAYPPGGPYGYARWATALGVANIELRGETQRIEAGHRGWIWPIRTGIGAILLVIGLAMAFDALKFATPVRNVLLPGEEYEEIED